MEGFGDNFDQPEVDPAAEFLAREHDQLAGLEDELNPVVLPSVNDGSFVPQGSALPQIDHTGSFEMIDNFGQDGFESGAIGSEGGTPEDRGVRETESAVPQEETSEAQPKLFASPTPTRPVTREEPEKIKKWREEQKKRLEEKDANEEKRKEELREGARKELAEWYRHHEEQIAKTKTANRNAEKQFVAESDEIEPGTEWERIAKLCDFNPKSSKTSKDVSRMRSIILQLKQTAPAPKRT
ncbi:Clathrin light chain [Cryptotermes secundus]|uniref:Clathrin light chain n=1 Tax=Cryptotermes secundus TaxID=105785 RepID=A0A2J7Q0X3_9NEOP|nr:clathrin light chain isoform X2 [Cryptotermes secundus]PNF22216.1 Clathrin light chain [Cryptotermes secundus]PNF22220.1 Clathrin light chain [Cryptotermes secundus]